MCLFLYLEKGCEVVGMRWYRRVLVMLLVLVTILETGLSIEKFHTEFKKEQVISGNLSNTTVILGGMPVGIYMKADGVLVLGTDEIECIDGVKYAPANNLVREGDYIIGLNGRKIESKSELVSAVAKMDSSEAILEIRREGEEIQVKMNAVQVTEEDYKLGVWVKDSMQGLGTVTYLKEDGSFGALGHGIYDTDSSDLLEMREGRLYHTDILGVKKGIKGTPGGIEGVIIYHARNYLGFIEENTDIGIYGRIEDLNAFLDEKKVVPVAKKKQVKLGNATIYCTVENSIETFEVEIEQIDYFPREKNKGMVIRITDERLLEKTGGIVQGMSGSPVIQNGKLVGAVTHVLVNDPTRGYAIFIENMLETANQVAEEQALKDAS